MDVEITATELAKSLSDVLSRVRYKGETFVIRRNGEPIATLAPRGRLPGITLGELVTALQELGPVDDRFAGDLEAIQASQGTVPDSPWPD